MVKLERFSRTPWKREILISNLERICVCVNKTRYNIFKKANEVYDTVAEGTRFLLDKNM